MRGLCSICHHSQRGVIDEHLSGGRDLRSLADEYASQTCRGIDGAEDSDRSRRTGRQDEEFVMRKALDGGREVVLPYLTAQTRRSRQVDAPG